MLRIRENGRREWWVNGQLHREDGPAVEWATGSKEWYLNDILQRVDCANGSRKWYLNGKAVSEKHYLRS